MDQKDSSNETEIDCSVAAAWNMLPEEILADNRKWRIGIISLAVKCHGVSLNDFISGPNLRKEVMQRCRDVGRPWKNSSKTARLSLWRRQLKSFFNVEQHDKQKNMNDKVEFNFRVWVHPEDGDSADIEVWYHGIESTAPNAVSIVDWAQEILGYENFHRLFDLDRTKHWQVIGKATLRSYSDYWGGYDEDLDIIEFEKAEVPEEWFNNNILSLDETETHDSK